MTPPRGGRCLPVREDLSGDLPVQAGSAAIHRRSAGVQVAAVIGAEVVVARGGFSADKTAGATRGQTSGFDGLSSPLEWGRGRGPFYNSVCPEVIAAVV
jgi:hypothetical protein